MAEAQVPFNPFPSVEGTDSGIDIPSTAADFGGQIAESGQRLGQTLQQAGGQLMDARLAKAQLMNETFASDASTALMKKVTDLYGQFSKNEGKAAVEALPGFQKSLDQAYKDTLATLPNLAAKAQAARSLRYTTDAYYRYAQNYSDTQFRAWQDKSATDRADELGNQATLAINNPEQMNTFLNGSDDEIKKLYEARGWDQTAIASQVKANRGSNIFNIVSTMIDQGDTKGAAAIYNLYDDQIDDGSKVKILGKLRPALTADRANNIVNTVIGQGPIAPNILRAQINQESGGDSGAISPKGAAGIMQLMPATAKMVAEEMGLPYDEARLTSDPAYNMALGTHYMESLLKRFNGNYALALAAYNAGPGRVDQWIARNGAPGTSPEDQAAWIAKIPIQETRNYVQSILTAAGGAPDQAAGGALPDRSIALQDAMNLTEGNPLLRSSVLAQLNQQYTVEAAANADQDRQIRLFNEQRKATNQAAQSEYISDALSPDPKYSVQDIANDARLLPDTQMLMINFVNAQNKGEPPAAVSRRTSSELFRRMNLPEGNPDKITTLTPLIQARIDGTLTNSDFDFLNKQYTDAQTSTGQLLAQTQGQLFDGVKSRITRSNPFLGKIYPQEDYKFWLYQQYVTQQVAKFKEAGKDPAQLFNPASPDYVASDKTLAQFQTPMDQTMQDIVTRSTGGLSNSDNQAAPPDTYHNVLGDAISGAVKSFQQFSNDVYIQNIVEAYRSSLVQNGVSDADADKMSADYAKELEAGEKTQAAPPTTQAPAAPYQPPKRLPGESLEDYDKRKQSSLSPEQFRALDLGSKLKHLDSLLG